MTDVEYFRRESDDARVMGHHDRAARYDRAADVLEALPVLREYVAIMESNDIQGMIAFAALRGVGLCSAEEANHGQAVRVAAKAAVK